jgi:hypothetical protein
MKAPLRRRKSTTYYVTVLLTLALTFGFGVAAITGGGILSADESLAIALHDSPAVVKHPSHEQTLLGNLLFGRQAIAHAYPYCGTSSIWKTIDGVLHKIVYRFTYDNGDHAVKSAHYKFTGTGYTRLSSWTYFRVDC